MITYRQLRKGMQMGLSDNQIREKYPVDEERYARMFSRLRHYQRLQQIEQMRIVLCETPEGRAMITLAQCLMRCLETKIRTQAARKG